MHDKDISAYLALHRTPSLTDKALCRLLQAVAEVGDIFLLSSEQLTRLQVPLAAQRLLHRPPDKARLEQDYQRLQDYQIQLVPYLSPDYPELLKHIDDPPPLLYVRGNIALLNQPQIAMVGSRRCSRQGGENAFRFARELAGNGFTVTSGLALGVDTDSHRGALAANGNTMAVLGTGVDVVYPRQNHSLFADIAERGLIVSEFPLGAEPRPSRFPKRNRLISGMSLGVLVIEAALQSGSLITARCALEQGREVFAIPGSIHSTASKGCHALIRQGAKLVETAADILEELQAWLPSVPCSEQDQPPSPAIDLNAKEQELLAILGFDPVAMDQLQQRCQWPLPELTASLTTLELKGVIETIGACYQRVA